MSCLHCQDGMHLNFAEGDAERAKAMNMMRMLASRQNSKWVEEKDWDVPYTFDATKFPTLLGIVLDTSTKSCMLTLHAALLCW